MARSYSFSRRRSAGSSYLLWSCGSVSRICRYTVAYNGFYSLGVVILVRVAVPSIGYSATEALTGARLQVAFSSGEATPDHSTRRVCRRAARSR